MELTWIEDFLALTRTQNFTQAAEQRCTTQPAFSRRIQQLEEWLGTPLFDRATRPIQLTGGGEEFLRRATRIREDMLDARRIAMSSKSHYQQAVRIYTTTAIAAGIIPKLLKETTNINHSILTSSTGGCLEALRQKRADRIYLPWFADDVPDQQLHYTKIIDDNLILVESSQTKKHLVLAHHVLSGDIIMHAPGTIFGQQIARHLAALKVSCDSNVMCESSSTEAVLALVKQGLGAAWIPQSLADAQTARCQVLAKLEIPCVVMMITREE